MAESKKMSGTTMPAPVLLPLSVTRVCWLDPWKELDIEGNPTLWKPCQSNGRRMFSLSRVSTIGICLSGWGPQGLGGVGPGLQSLLNLPAG